MVCAAAALLPGQTHQLLLTHERTRTETTHFALLLLLGCRTRARPTCTCERRPAGLPCPAARRTFPPTVPAAAACFRFCCRLSRCHARNVLLLPRRAMFVADRVVDGGRVVEALGRLHWPMRGPMQPPNLRGSWAGFLISDVYIMSLECVDGCWAASIRTAWFR